MALSHCHKGSYCQDFHCLAPASLFFTPPAYINLLAPFFTMRKMSESMIKNSYLHIWARSASVWWWSVIWLLDSLLFLTTIKMATGVVERCRVNDGDRENCWMISLAEKYVLAFMFTHCAWKQYILTTHHSSFKRKFRINHYPSSYLLGSQLEQQPDNNHNFKAHL